MRTLVGRGSTLFAVGLWLAAAACGGDPAAIDAAPGPAPDAPAASDAPPPLDAAVADAREPDARPPPPDADPCPECIAPSVVGASATPSRVRVGGTTRVVATATDPDSPVASVTVDLALLAGTPVALRDDGAGPDTTAGDGEWAADVPVPALAPAAVHALPVVATDTTGLTGATTLTLEVQPLHPVARFVQGAPHERVGGCATYDPVASRVVLFGAAGGAPAWAWSSTGRWAPVWPSGPEPPARDDAACTYDPVAHRLIVAGGIDWNTSPWTPLNDVWALDLAAGAEAWSEITPAGVPPSPRGGTAHAYDPASHRLIMTGGGAYPSGLNDTWALDLTAGAEAWTELTPGGPLPAPVMYGAMAIDPGRARAILVHGYDDATGTESDQLLALDLTPGAEAWTTVVATGPAGRQGGVLAYDATNDRFVLVGGYASTPDSYPVWSLSAMPGAESFSPLLPTGLPLLAIAWPSRAELAGPVLWLYGLDYSRELWTLDLSFVGDEVWLQRGNGLPPPRSGRALGFDRVGDRLYVHGGEDPFDPWGGAYNDLWSLRVAPGVPVWSQYAVAGSPYRARAAYTFAESRRELVIDGGGSSDIGFDSTHFLPVAPGAGGWRAYAPTNGEAHRLVFDEANDRLLLYSCDFSCLPGERVLDMDPATGAWSYLATGGVEPAVAAGEAQLVYDGARQRAILVHGTGAVWFLDLTPGVESWSTTTPPGAPSLGGFETIKGSGDRVWVYDGSLWALDLAPGAETWTPVPFDGPGVPAGIVFDPERNRILGYDASQGDVWELAHLED